MKQKANEKVSRHSLLNRAINFSLAVNLDDFVATIRNNLLRSNSFFHREDSSNRLIRRTLRIWKWKLWWLLRVIPNIRFISRNWWNFHSHTKLYLSSDPDEFGFMGDYSSDRRRGWFWYSDQVSRDDFLFVARILVNQQASCYICAQK